MTHLQIFDHRIRQHAEPVDINFTDFAGAHVELADDDHAADRQQGAGRAGVDPTPATTAEFVKAELAKWAPIIRASGAQVD